MTNSPISLAVRLIGFTPHEEELFDAAFLLRQGQERGPVYFRLEQHNLQDPDLYVANAEEMRALIALANLRPSDARPALLIGNPVVELPYSRIPRPIRWAALLDALDHLIGKRTEVLARLTAADTVVVTERRRRIRLDVDFTDPAKYERMRAKVPEGGAVLVVDSSSALRDGIAQHLAHHGTEVFWAQEEQVVVDICRQRPIAVVLVNTSTSGIDPYCLCRAVKDTGGKARIAVVFLIGNEFSYDLPHARDCGADGFLRNGLTTHQIAAVLQKFLPSRRRTGNPGSVRPPIC